MEDGDGCYLYITWVAVNPLAIYLGTKVSLLLLLYMLRGDDDLVR